MKLIEFYKAAKTYCIKQGYKSEIKIVKSRIFNEQTAEDLFQQFVYVVLNSGMKNQVAEKIYARLMSDLRNVALANIAASDHIIGCCVGHPLKRMAIREAFVRYNHWFEELKNAESVEEKLSFLESLPHIGPVTKYHLARNLGIDVAKPDRHLSRIAKFFGCDNVQEMCSQLSEQTGDRVGVVDVVLWRATVLKKGNFEKIMEV